MKKQTDIESLVLRYLQKTITEDEMKILMSWIKENEENKILFFQLKNMYDIASGLYPTPEEMVQSETRFVAKLKEVKNREHQKQIDLHKRQRWIALSRYSAVGIVFVLVTLGVQWLFNKESLPVYTELNVESGPRMSHMVLPDGTKVVLNASTTIRFPDKFKKDSREIYLDGEAFFDVAKDEKIPFVVSTNKQKIQVLGTKFNVMDYATDDYAITTLVSGRIKLQAFDEKGEVGDEIYMKPDQQFFFNKTTAHSNLSAIKIDMNRTWVNKIYHFHDEPLKRIIQRLEKLYGIDIRILTEELEDVLCTGTFALDQNIEDVLRILNFDKQFTYVVQDETIVIE